MTDDHWAEEYKEWKPGLKAFQIKLLDEGSESQSQQWLLNQMWCDWQQIKKTKDSDLAEIKNWKKDPWEDEDAA